jgi:cation:H+ antiporter
LAFKVAASAIAILTAGFLVARSGEAIANQTTLGSSFMGVVFLALATSLPEVSTVFSALRRGLQTMAISDILGTNILNVLLLFGVDAVASGGPVFDRVGNFAAVAALLGVVLTGVFLVGLAERRDRTVLRMGTDSLAVLVLYAGGLTLLYTMKDA